MRLSSLLKPALRVKLAPLHFFIAALYIGFAATYQLTDRAFFNATPDFFAYYTAGQLASGHISPYDKEMFEEKQFVLIEERTIIKNPASVLAFLNPPHMALLFVPFSAFNFLNAFMLWLVCNLFFSFMIARDTYRYLQQYRQEDRWFASCVAVGILPWCVALVSGQISILLGWALLRFFIELKKNNPVKAALWTLIFTLKPHLFLLLVIPMMVFGYWKLLRACIVLMAGIILLTAVYFGISIWGDYLHFLQQVMADGEQYGASTPAMMNLRGLIALHVTRLPLAVSVAPYLCAAAVITILSYKLRAKSAEAQQLIFTVALVAGALFGPWLHEHDTYIFFPAALMLLLASTEPRHFIFCAIAYASILIATIIQPFQQLLTFMEHPHAATFLMLVKKFLIFLIQLILLYWAGTLLSQKKHHSL